MKTIYQKKLHRPYEFSHKTVVAMGSFDGFHLGHQKLVETAIKYANEKHATSMIYTYENHPSTVLQEISSTHLITSNEVRTQLFMDIDVDCVYFEDFSNWYANLSPAEFVDEILVKKLNACAVIVGFDYRFGKHGEGNVEMLAALCKKREIEAVCVDPVYFDNQKVSSTRIRQSLKECDLDSVRQMLGRKFSIKGTVEYGKQLGGKMGFPTANIYPYEKQALPSNGVYVTNVYMDDMIYRGVTNVGINPTVEDGNYLKVETFIVDFDKDLYGQDIKVEFLFKLRGEMKFVNVKQLFKQIELDVKRAREYIDD